MTDIIAKEQEAIENIGKNIDLIKEIDLSQLPTIIDSQVEKIGELSKKIDTAIKAADKAKELTKEPKPVKWGHKKKAIEDLQKSGKKSAEAIGETVDALNLSFEYEKQLGEISKFLIAIAACSAVHTDKAIERINNAIQNRPANKPLNDVAKNRLLQIINQMEAHGDTIKKQEALERELKEKDVQDEEQDRQIREMAKDDDRQDALIEKLQKRIDDLEKWKVIALISSGSALLLTLLQIIGIL